MATTKYLIQGKSGNVPIYLRFSLNRTTSFKRKTGLFIEVKKWSNTTGLPIAKDPSTTNIKSKLKSLEGHIIDQYNNDNATGRFIDATWLELQIDSFFNRREKDELEYLIDFCDHYLTNLKTRNLEPSTQRKYTTIVNKLKVFEEYRKKRLLLIDVDLKFIHDLHEYFKNTENLSQNTIGRYIKFVKTIILNARENGFTVSQQIDSVKGFTVEPPKIILSLEELEQIKGAELSKEALEIARDWLIIGFYTGQRVSDLLRMKKSFIEKIQGFEFINIKQVKTKKLVQIPIHKEVRKVLDKWQGEFPPSFTDSLESNMVLFNRYLKDLCKDAKLNELTEGLAVPDQSTTGRKIFGKYEKWRLISSHICRRSFASHFYGMKNYPTPLLMNITAHSTERQFLAYVGKPPINYSLQLAQIWKDNS